MTISPYLVLKGLEIRTRLQSCYNSIPLQFNAAQTGQGLPQTSTSLSRCKSMCMKTDRRAEKCVKNRKRDDFKTKMRRISSI